MAFEFCDDYDGDDADNAVFVLCCSMLRFSFGSSPVAASSSSSAAGGAGAGAATTSSSSSRRIDDKYVKMLRRELEGDSVDTDILDEELRFLKEAEPKT